MATETLYYLFSTSAQVMAALAGLFGVFAIYAIQEFSDIFLSARGTARGAVFAGYERTSSGEKTWEDILLMSDEELFIDFTRLLNELPTAAVRSGMANEYDFNEKKRDYFVTLLKKKKDILYQLKKVLILSLMAIALSLFALLKTLCLIHTPLVVWLLVCYFLYCLYETGSGVYRLIAN